VYINGVHSACLVYYSSGYAFIKLEREKRREREKKLTTWWCR